VSADQLGEVLEEARELGFLGPKPVEEQIAHSLAVAELIGGPPESFLELGSGGGVPGLVLAAKWIGTFAVLLDSMERRCAFLRSAVEQLGLADRVAVREGRAEQLARSPELRGAFPAVIARGFGSPPIVAECAVGFLARCGTLYVTEPPGTDDETGRRWPADALQALGFTRQTTRRTGSGTTEAGVAVLTTDRLADDRWPRRVGVPAKRPLW
jgi:16S rRNA (guanine527-N7)-methyltransferase